MNLELTETQQLLRDLVRKLCAEHCTRDVVRAMEDDPRGYPDALWKQFAETGLLGLLVPEAHGGAGQGVLEAALVHEELGRALAPLPAFVSGVVATRALLRAGGAAQQKEWLPRIARGEALASVAWLEPQSGFGPRGVRMRAQPAKAPGVFRLSGEKRHVAFARAATRLLTLARTGEGARDVALFWVDPRAPGVSLTQVKTLAGDAQYDLRFENVEAERLGDAAQTAPSAWAHWEEVMHDAAIVLAATAIGGAARAHEITTQYARERKQFDKPLGAFQAIAHNLADAITRIDGGRVLVYEAAWARDAGRDVRRLAPMAKLFACDTYRDTTAVCEQIWGGVGFTVEYDIQLYFRRAKQLQLTWWDAPYLEERIAAEVLDR